MNWDRATGNWKQLKGKVKEKWGDLTDDDLDRILRDEAEKQVRAWEKESRAEEEATDPRGRR
jgi:hypothetical protein